MAGVVMLFHSEMSRMKRTLPEAVDGESDPKIAQLAGPPRRHDEGEERDARDGRSERDRGPAGLVRAPRPPAVPGEGQAKDDQDQQPVVARQGRQAGEQACAGEGPARPLETAGAEPEGARDERLVEREVVRLDEVDRRQQRDRDEHARAGLHPGPRAGVAGDRPGQRSGERADQRERRRRCPGDVAEHDEERHLDERGERHPVRVRRDGQRRVGRDRAADLGEDPDEVDVEALARMERSRDVDVVGRIGVGRLREVPDEDRPNGQGEPVQQ